MRIAFLAGANSIHAVRWVNYFADRNHVVIWISLAPQISEAQEVVKKTKFYEITPSPLSDIGGLFATCHLPLAVWQIRKILKKEKPDLIHVHSAGTYGLIGALNGFHPRVLTPWGSDILLASALKRPITRFVVRSADAYTCDGENTKARLIELGAQQEKIHLIRFGTDVEKFKPANRKEQRAKSKLKIISLRSLELIYDIETLIRAAAIVIKSAPNVEFMLAGDGSQREYLEQTANSGGLIANGTIKFIGKINNDLLPNYLQNADIYVSTSLSDSGLAASTAEAMAAGLPVIVTDSGDSAQWVEDGSAGSPRAGGFVIPIKNPEILAEKILFLLNNKTARESFGARNRKIIEEKNNYYVEMARAEKLYEKIIALH